MQRKQQDKQIEEEFEEEPQQYNDIDKLQEKGINVADILKLKQVGFCTVRSLLMATRKELLNVKGITEAKLDKIQQSASEMEMAGFISGSEVFVKRQQILRITTGSSVLDQLLGGGVDSMALTEVFGEFRTGKTQLCHTLSVTCQLDRRDGGGGGKVAYIDTEGTFRPERIHSISERFGMDPEQTLDNIAVARAFTWEHLNSLLTQVAAKMVEERFSLLIIDSIMALFRVDFSGRGELSERQNALGKVLSKCTKIAEQFNVVVFMTNQVMSDPAGGTMAFADTRRPIGGNIMAHASTTRLYLRKGRGEQRVCKIYDSPSLPESECIFQISEGGIINAIE